jgi:cytochrome oxidase assembly protein ShyY1
MNALYLVTWISLGIIATILLSDITLRMREDESTWEDKASH